MATANEKFIKENTCTSHKRWESMVVYALHYALRDVEIRSQFLAAGYLIDAYIPALKLAIEIDEEHHAGRNDEDKIREESIKKSLDCEFIRIDVRNDVYQQVDSIVDKVKAHKLPKWTHTPQARQSGEFTRGKLEGLEKAGTDDFVKTLRTEFDDLGFKTSDCQIPGHIPKGNGYLGFMINMDGIEFSISVTPQNMPKVLVTRFRPEQQLLERLGLRLSEPKKNGEYYNIEDFSGQQTRDKVVDFFQTLMQKL